MEKKTKEKNKLTELKGEMNNSIIIVGNFNIPLSIMNNTIIQKITKYIKDLNNAIHQPVLMSIGHSTEQN